MLSPTDFRSAMARLGSAVSVVTTDGPAGRYGLTVSAVCSVTDNPPTLLVCINRGSAANAAIRRNAAVCVNVLSSQQQAVADRFSRAGVPAAERFAGAGDWLPAASGSPRLTGAAVMFDCRVVEASEVGSHSVFFCEVDAVSADAGAGCLIYHGRSYHGVGVA